MIFAFSTISACRENHIDSESENLIKALRNKDIDISDEIEYTNLIEKLKNMSVVFPGSYENATMAFLDDHADTLIQLPTSKPGILSWHFERIFFIKKDLVFASFSDGEMYGGDLLVEIIQSGDQIESAETIWNYHK